MTAPALQLPPQPMPAEKRFRIATAGSLGFHLLLLIFIGLLAGRTPLRPPVLIPIELTISEASADALVLGGGGHPEAPPKTTAAPAATARPSNERPSSPGGPLERAPAPPRILTSPSGTEPAGPRGSGREPAGPGGQEEVPAGPTRGPNILGGPAPFYPKDAMDRGLEGSVTLAVVVAQDGSVSSVTVASSSGHEDLDRAAKQAVQQRWAFDSALENGKPAPGKVNITFRFHGGRVERE